MPTTREAFDLRRLLFCWCAWTTTPMASAEMAPSDWIAVGATLVALIAMLISFRSSRIAAKAFALAARQEERHRPALSLSLLQSELRRLGKKGPRVYVFRIMVSNTSDSPTALRDAQLELEYGVRGCPLSSLVAPHDEKIASRLTGLAAEPLRLPCALQPRSSIAGTVLFEVPSSLLRQSYIESCTIQVEDSLGHTASLEAVFIQERE